MFCIACGTQNPDHAKFCMKCGAHAAEQAASTGGTFTPASSMKSNYPQAAPAAKVMSTASAASQASPFKKEPDWEARRNRSTGAKMIYGCIFLTFFYLSPLAKTPIAGNEMLYKVFLVAVVGTSLAFLTGLYKAITGR
jgi:hypothetical protein